MFIMLLMTSVSGHCLFKVCLDFTVYIDCNQISVFQHCFQHSLACCGSLPISFFGNFCETSNNIVTAILIYFHIICASLKTGGSRLLLILSTGFQTIQELL